MAVEIVGNKAIVKCDFLGKPAEFELERMSQKDFFFLLGEFLEVVGDQTTVHIDKLLVGSLPKCLKKAPYPCANMTEIMNAPADAGAILELSDAIMELHGLKNIGKASAAKKE